MCVEEFLTSEEGGSGLTIWKTNNKHNKILIYANILIFYFLILLMTPSFRNGEYELRDECYIFINECNVSLINRLNDHNGKFAIINVISQ